MKLGLQLGYWGAQPPEGVGELVEEAERSLAFYRNLLGMRVVKQTVNEDDRGARHLFFGDEHGASGPVPTVAFP